MYQANYLYSYKWKPYRIQKQSPISQGFLFSGKGGDKKPYRHLADNRQCGYSIYRQGLQVESQNTRRDR